MVQSDLNETPNGVVGWFKIPGPHDAKKQCAVLGCSMDSVISDGKRSLCSLHATEPATRFDIVLRVAHQPAPEHHVDGGHCVNCGGNTWIYNTPLGVYQCVSCAAANTFQAPTLIDIRALPPIDGALLSALPVGRATPPTDGERARTRAWVDEYLAWRNR